MKKCPFCAEEIQSEAIKCKHCGEMVNTIDNSLNLNNTLKFKKIKESKIEKENLNNSIENIKENNGKVDFKSKMINLLIHLVYFISSIIVSFLYALSDKSDTLNKGDFSEVGSSFLSSFLIIFLLGNYFYRKVRGKLGSSLKENLIKIGKGLIQMIIMLSLYYFLFTINIGDNQKKELNDLENISKSLNNYDGNIENSSGIISSIKKIETNSYLGNSIKDYLKEIQEINTTYQNGINGLGDVYLNSKYYNNQFEIKQIINNLNELGKITKTYEESKKSLKTKYPQIDLIQSEQGTIEYRKKETEVIESEKKFITDSLNTYKYLLDIQEYIEINDGEIGIYDNNVRNKLNNLIELMNNSLVNYENKKEELSKTREKLINENINTLQK